MSAREVTLGSVLTITTGCLVEGMSRAWDDMDHLAGWPLMTHERPDVSRALTPWLLRLFPRLAEAEPPRLTNEAECRAWVAEVAEHAGWTPWITAGAILSEKVRAEVQAGAWGRVLDGLGGGERR